MSPTNLSDNPHAQDAASSAVQVALAWIFVGIPLAWGVFQTLLNAMKLFQ
jgi:hypothetical protein